MKPTQRKALYNRARSLGIDIAELRDRYIATQPDEYPQDFGHITFFDWLAEQLSTTEGIEWMKKICPLAKPTK